MPMSSYKWHSFGTPNRCLESAAYINVEVHENDTHLSDLDRGNIDSQPESVVYKETRMVSTSFPQSSSSTGSAYISLFHLAFQELCLIVAIFYLKFRGSKIALSINLVIFL